MGNSYGKIFKLTTFGESHGASIGGIIDGCPSGIKIDLEGVLVNQKLLANEMNWIELKYCLEFLMV